MACHRIFVCSFSLLQLLMLVSTISTHSTSKPLQGSWEHSPTQVLATNDHDEDAFSGKEIDNYYYSVGGRKMASVKTVGAAKMEGVVKIGGVELGKKKHNNVGGGDELKKQEAGFVAFNEDYHAPRHHPPKNN